VEWGWLIVLGSASISLGLFTIGKRGVLIVSYFLSVPVFKSSDNNQTRGLFYGYLQLAHKKIIPKDMLIGLFFLRAMGERGRERGKVK
jgi:hypothetical protein